MRVNHTTDLWRSYLKLFNNHRMLRNNPVFSQTDSTLTCSDTLTISRDTKFFNVQETINSGEPLTGIGYEEFKEFYYWLNHNFLSEREMKQTYHQALRGTNDIIAKQDWYGEGIMLTPVIINSSAFQEHASVLAEKWANGEELTEKQRFVLRADERIFMDSYVKRTIKAKSEQIGSLFAKNGIELAENERVQISLNGFKFRVSGDFSEEKRTAIENTLNSMTKKEKSSYMVLYMRDNVSSYVKNITKDKRFISASVGETEFLLEHFSGAKIKLQDLFIDDSGQVQGLPNELADYFEGVTTDKDAPIEKSNLSERNEIMFKRIQKEAMETAVTAMHRLGYENLPRYSFEFEFSGGMLKAVDKYL